MEKFEVRDSRNQVMSVKEWIITMLIMMIPVANIVMLFVWGLGDSGNRNRVNWAKAQLIMFLIMMCLWIFAAVVFGSDFLALFRGEQSDF
jgi:membrane protein YdbS with pleckstrin-like domain